MRLSEFITEQELEEDWKKTVGALGAAGALVVGANHMAPPKASVKPPVAATVENPDVRVLAQTIWGEARSHGPTGM